MVNLKNKKAKPFLKWAGGKTQLLSEIEKLIPYHSEDSFVFIEPFVGSGSVLFFMLNNYPKLSKIVINDLNSDLINCYRVIKEKVDLLIANLKELEQEYNNEELNAEQHKAFFYTKRTTFNLRNQDDITQAALFIFLNRTCFNGLYRVNRNNEFNVPQGSYKKPQILNKENLILVSKALQKVEITNESYQSTIKYASSNSFFYFDPPYKPLSSTSSFNAYANNGFNDKEQIELKEFCDQISDMGSQWALSNSDVKGIDPSNDFFDDLYEDYQIARVLAKRSINSKAEKRGKLTEILVSHIL